MGLRGPMPKRRWLPHEVTRLVELVEDHELSWDEVVLAMPGRTKKECQSRYYSVDDRRHTGRQAAALSFQHTKIPDGLEADRQARQAARDARNDASLARGDITPVFFGDPPPGYSALDLKRAARA